MSSPQVARHLRARAEPTSELVPSTPFPPSENYDPTHVVKMVWGTAVEINEVIRLFNDFLRQFKQKHRIVQDNPHATSITHSENQPFYPQLLEQVTEWPKKLIVIMPGGLKNEF